jgi:hypothetical protein
MEWWEEMGYPPFEAGRNGFPRTGEVIKYYRERKVTSTGELMFSQKDVATILGLKRYQSYADIENHDAEINPDRRELLCGLFGIPPLLLKVVTLEQAIHTATSISQSRALDLEEFRQYLRIAWQSDHTYCAQHMLPEILMRIDSLYDALPLANVPAKAQIHELLCDYHLFVANLLRDQQQYPAAIRHLNKAYLTADALNSNERRALIHFRRSNIFGDAKDIAKALTDIEQANLHQTKLPYYLHGPILIEAGLAHARVATTQTDRLDAMRLLNQGAHIIELNQGGENPHQSDLSIDRTRITRTVAFLAVGWNKNADEEIGDVQCGPDQARRQAYQDILQATTHIRLERYDVATVILQSALRTMQAIQSRINVERIRALYQELVKVRYESHDMQTLDRMLGIS